MRNNPAFRVPLILLLMTAVLSAAEPYSEAYRPQFHFSPKVNWTNDPCGLVYADGQYHLFFQNNPFGDLWGHMSWGHAVSPDLIKWIQLPTAIPESPDSMIFTGSSVVDTNGTSSLCEPKKACIVSIYTGHIRKTGRTPQRQNQNLAVSQDGRTWKKYPGNPVLDLNMADFRDPKVFWHAASKQWVMVVVLPQDKKASIYGSPNLKQWKHLSDFGPAGATGGVWECPDLFELPVDGGRNRKRWVLKIGLNPGHIAGGSGEQYFVGEFDGVRFQNSQTSKEPLWLDYGRDCYCALTWNADRATETHMIGWMNNWQYARQTPTSPWRGTMTLPRSLELRSSSGDVRLAQSPVHALHSLRAKAFAYQGKNVAELNRKLSQWPHRSQTFEILAVIRPGNAKRITWKVLEGPDEYTLIGFDAAARQLFVDRTRSAHTDFSERFPSRTTAPLEVGTNQVELHVFVDRSSVEVFSDNGRVVITNLVFPNSGSTGISMAEDGGEIDSVHVNLWKLRSIWTTAAGVR